MTDWVDKYVNEKRFKEKFETLETIEDKVRFCKGFLAEHAPTELHVKTDELKYDNATGHLVQPMSVINVHTPYGPVETLTFHQTLDEQLAQDPMNVEEAKFLISQEFVKTLWKQGFLKFDEHKRFDTYETVIRAKLHAVKPK